MMEHSYTRRDFLKAVGLTAASLTLPGCGSLAETAEKRPNIIFVMTDDQGPWAFGEAPNPNAHTPNLDRLCTEGVRLTNYFVTTPVCSPSRAGLITSRYATEVGIPDYLSSRQPKLGLGEQFRTWPEILAAGGYQTALCGSGIWAGWTNSTLHGSATMSLRAGAPAPGYRKTQRLR